MLPSLLIEIVRSRKSAVVKSEVVFQVSNPNGRSFFMFSNSCRSFTLLTIHIPKMSSMNRLNYNKFLLYFGRSVSFSCMP